MSNDTYPAGTVARLLPTVHVKLPTAAVLKSRMKASDVYIPEFFNDAEFKLLGVVSNLLIPQGNNNAEQVNLAALFDKRMESGQGKGWRYDLLPPDQELFKSGFSGIEETALAMYAEKFIFLSFEKQHSALSMIQSGHAKGDVWQQVPAALFFTELLASLSELYYSHPIAKDDIGEVAYADGLGWNKIGLNEHEPFEPLPLSAGGHA